MSEIKNLVGQEVIVQGRVSVPWNGQRPAFCIEDCVVVPSPKSGVYGRAIPVRHDHSWVQIPDVSDDIREESVRYNRGQPVQYRAVVGEYVHGNGSPGWNFQDVERIE